MTNCAVDCHHCPHKEAFTLLTASLEALQDVDVAHNLQRGLILPGDFNAAGVAALYMMLLDSIEQRMLELAGNQNGLTWLRNYQDQCKELREDEMRDPDLSLNLAKGALSLLSALEADNKQMAMNALAIRYWARTRGNARSMMGIDTEAAE